MPTGIAKNTIKFARKLRKDMSDGELKLWAVLRRWKRNYGVHVRKQVPIGKYIADFAIHDLKLIIEVDGHQHLVTSQMAHDKKRDAWLREQGYKVIRFSSADITDAFDGCIEEILREAGLL